MISVPIDVGTGTDVLVASLDSNKVTKNIQFINLSGGTITVEESVDGRNFNTATFDGDNDFIVSEDSQYKVWSDKNFIQCKYSGDVLPKDLKIILR